MIDKLPTINFVKHYLDDVSLVLDDLKHQQLGDCFTHAVALHFSWSNCANICAAKGAYLCADPIVFSHAWRSMNTSMKAR
jgi:hypothetical protein